MGLSRKTIRTAALSFAGGRYQLYGDGTRVPYYWVWVPSGATVAPAPPAPPPVPTR